MNASRLKYLVETGLRCGDGPHACFFCGSRCGDAVRTADSISDSFTGFNQVARPDSPFVCDGCASCLDGEDRSKRPRMFSWVIADRSATPYTKGQLSELAAVCTHPPEPPFAITVAVSGQKHLLYRTPLNLSREVVTLRLEEQLVEYRPRELAARIELCKRIAAASGKPAMASEPQPSLAVLLSKHFRGWEPLLEEWVGCWAHPLSRLAAHLCPKKETCQHEYPSDFTVPAEATPDVRPRDIPADPGRTDGPGLFG